MHEVLGMFATERDAALRGTRDLLDDADEPDRAGLAILEELLTGVDPVLWPVGDGPPPAGPGAAVG